MAAFVGRYHDATKFRPERFNPVALHVVSPPPTDADHAEVRSKLQRGTWK